MKVLKKPTFYMVVLCSLVLFGCREKTDESKPVGEIRAEAEKMGVARLRSMAMTYKDAIAAKKKDVENFAGKLKEIPATEMLGTQAKQIKDEIDGLNKSISALTERFQIYYEQIKVKGGNLAGLEL